MNFRRGIIALGLLVALLGAAPSAYAIVVDGNVSDWGITPGPFGGSDWTPNSGIYIAEEDQDPNINFLNPGWGGQDFDVEAILFTRDASIAYFAVVTGFPLTGRPGYLPGDFAIDFGSDGTYEFGVETTGNLAGSAQGQLYGNATWLDPLFTVCGPYALAAGTLLGNLDFVYDPLTYINDAHYVFEFGIPISLFGTFWNNYIPQFTAHWTMSCGNDCLDLNVPASPEPMTMTLLGMGLAGLGLRRRLKG